MPEPKAAQDRGQGGNAGSAGAVLNPYRNFAFKVTAGDIVGHFTRCTGLGMRVHPIAYSEGGRRGEVVQLVGPVEYSEVTLSYGIIKADQLSLWNWLNAAARNQRDRRQVFIELMGPDEQDVLSYTLNEAWISQWQGAALDALGREFAVESISLVYQSIGRQ